MWNNVSACNAECLHIFSHCICHCLPGYILVDGKCIKSKIPFFFIMLYSVLLVHALSYNITCLRRNMTTVQLILIYFDVMPCWLYDFNFF